MSIELRDMHDVRVLNDGYKIPRLGFGTYKASPEDAYNSVRDALDAGYRHIDTATFYHNEADVGRAIAHSNVPREEIFITTKIWPTDFEKASQTFDESIKLLGLDYLDLYLIHWPGTKVDLRHRVWDMMNEKREQGKLRSLGVSNFSVNHLEDLAAYSKTAPAVNQIEMHPFKMQPEVAAYCNAHDIAITSWAPIFQGRLSEAPLMEKLGKKYGKSAAQVTLRWHLQHGFIIIPKSTHKERIVENTKLYDFEISEEDMKSIDALNRNKGLGRGVDNQTFDGIL
ncbi:MAG: aldo/keto reductase [Christensenellaceae bacterium]|jgi:diketogulonate reductase-like aldo/keto reductase